MKSGWSVSVGGSWTTACGRTEPVVRPGCPVSAVAMAPASPALQALPNPGTGVMNLTLALPKSGDVLLRLLDAQGREAARRTLSGLGAGVRRFQWDVQSTGGHGLASGSYWVRMDAPSGSRTARWILIR